MSIINRIFNLSMQSFKYLYREKSTFLISSFTISLCLVLVSLVSTLTFHSVKKILSMDSHKILVTFKKDIESSCETECRAEEEKMIEIDRCPVCPSYDPSKLSGLSNDTPLEKEGKQRCKECIDKEYNKDDKRPSNKPNNVPTLLLLKAIKVIPTAAIIIAIIVVKETFSLRKIYPSIAVMNGIAANIIRVIAAEV